MSLWRPTNRSKKTMATRGCCVKGDAAALRACASSNCIDSRKRDRFRTCLSEAWAMGHGKRGCVVIEEHWDTKCRHGLGAIRLAFSFFPFALCLAKSWPVNVSKSANGSPFVSKSQLKRVL